MYDASKYCSTLDFKWNNEVEMQTFSFTFRIMQQEDNNSDTAKATKTPSAMFKYKSYSRIADPTFKLPVFLIHCNDHSILTNFEHNMPEENGMCCKLMTSHICYFGGC